MPTYHFRSERRGGNDQTGGTLGRQLCEPILSDMLPDQNQNVRRDCVQWNVSNNCSLVTPLDESFVDGDIQPALSASPQAHRAHLKAISLTKHAQNRRHSIRSKTNYGPRALDLKSACVLSFAALLITVTRRASHTLYDTLFRDRIARRTSTNLASVSLGRFSNESIVHSAEKDPGIPPEPSECRLWRHVAHIPSRLMLYRSHFNSPQVIDWFVYAAIFDEKWHVTKSDRPQYIDIGAKHPRHHSKTWFLDRCLRWHGLCFEPNSYFWDDLKEQRSCQLHTTTCALDRNINTSAFGTPPNSSSANAVWKVSQNSSGQQLSRNCIDDVQDKSCRGSQFVIEEYSRQKDGMVHYSYDIKLHFDLMVMDSACQELLVLKGIDWNRTEIDVLLTSHDDAIVEFLETKDYERFSEILKGDIWIRSGSGLRINFTVVSWLGALDFSNYSFSRLEDGDPFIYT